MTTRAEIEAAIEHAKKVAVAAPFMEDVAAISVLIQAATAHLQCIGDKECDKQRKSGGCDE